MRECLDEGILQSYFDGELPHEQMESATSHLAACKTCAAVARELEHENSLLASALAPEFQAPVPTERLRQRIDAAIAGMRTVDYGAKGSTIGWLQSLASLFAFTPQRAFGYAGLAVVLAFGVIFGIIWRQVPSPAVENGNGVASTSSDPAPVRPGAAGESTLAIVTPSPSSRTPTPATDPTPKSRPVKPRPPISNQSDAQLKLLPGERSYLKTIAALDSTIKSKSNRPMRPSLQSEYERNLAVVNHALAATRSAAKKNPNDPDAAEFMFAAYQSKVDLLNTVADARVYNRQQ